MSMGCEHHAYPNLNCARCATRAAQYRAGVLAAKTDARGLVIDRLSRLPAEPISHEMSDAEIEAAMRRVVKRLEAAVQHL